MVERAEFREGARGAADMRTTGLKLPGDSLGDEIQQERAAVLGRAGEMLAGALEKLHLAGKRIDERVRFLEEPARGYGKMPPDTLGPCRSRERVREINAAIDAYNELREHVQLRYYYLIVTREAMGLLRHDRLREIYVIPDKRGHLHAGRG